MLITDEIREVKFWRFPFCAQFYCTFIFWWESGKNQFWMKEKWRSEIWSMVSVCKWIYLHSLAILSDIECSMVLIGKGDENQSWTTNRLKSSSYKYKSKCYRLFSIILTKFCRLNNETSVRRCQHPTNHWPSNYFSPELIT